MKRTFAAVFVFAGALAAQPPQPAVPAIGATPPPVPVTPEMPRLAGTAPSRDGRLGPPPPAVSRPPMERALMPGPPGRWWNNAQMAQRLGINSDQQKKMDDIFQQNRLRLVDLNASLQKDELILEPLVAAEQPDETKILAQIDKVAQARAELEKANARFLLGIRRILTQDQWKKLQAEAQPNPGPARVGMPVPRPGGPGAIPPPPAEPPRPGR